MVVAPDIIMPGLLLLYKTETGIAVCPKNRPFTGKIDRLRE